MEGNIAKLYNEYSYVPNYQQNTNTDSSKPVSFKSQPYYDIKLQDNIKEDTVILSNKNATLLEEINKRDRAAKSKDELIKFAASPIAPLRRVMGVKDATKEDKIKTVGLALLAANNLPMDISDIKTVVNQIKGKNIKANPGQIEFTFAQDTLLEFGLRKLRQANPKKFDKYYDKIDKSMFNTKIGKIIQKKLNIEVEKTAGSTLDIIKDGIKPNIIYKLNGSKFAKLVGNSMLRIPVLGVAFFALLEVPGIIKAVKNEPDKNNKIKAAGAQALKAGINIASMVTGMATVGAILDRRLGALGSLLGIGFGSYFGSKLGEKVNEKIFDTNNH